MEDTYSFTIGVEEEEDGRWSAWLLAIPWCTAFGDTKEEAIEELRDAAQVAVQYLKASGRPVPVDDLQRLEVTA